MEQVVRTQITNEIGREISVTLKKDTETNEVFLSIADKLSDKYYVMIGLTSAITAEVLKFLRDNLE